MKKLLFVFAFVFAMNSYSQNNVCYMADTVPQFLKVYLDCNVCYPKYLREKMDYIQFVNDQADADVYVMGTTQINGGGGVTYKYFVSGQGRFNGKNDTLLYNSSPLETDGEKREVILSHFSAFLMRYIAYTGFYENILITSCSKTKDYSLLISEKDKWNKWVFDIKLNGTTSGREDASQTKLRERLLVSKVTQNWKAEIKEDFYYSWDNFDIDGEKVLSNSNQKVVSAYYAKNINDHWAIGGKYELYSSTKLNIKGAHHFSPVVEYNLFKYEEASRRQLRFMNKLEPKMMYYYDTTIYNKMKEFRIDNIFSIGYELREKFGDILITFQARNYWDDLSLQRYSLRSNLDIRVIKGLFVNLDGKVSYIADQLYLSKEGASDEDILLGNTAVNSSFEYNFRVGLKYKFGSIYNSVVNPIFGDI